MTAELTLISPPLRGEKTCNGGSCPRGGAIALKSSRDRLMISSYFLNLLESNMSTI